jgi:hypothetical protein
MSKQNVQLLALNKNEIFLFYQTAVIVFKELYKENPFKIWIK